MKCRYHPDREAKITCEKMGMGYSVRNVLIIVRRAQTPVCIVSSGNRASYGSYAARARRDIVWSELPVANRKHSSRNEQGNQGPRLSPGKGKRRDEKTPVLAVEMHG